MKPFDLEAAKRGEPVCTKTGGEVRIICFDSNIFNEYGTKTPIVSLVTNMSGQEVLWCFLNDASCALGQSPLFMAPKKVTKYVRVFSNEGVIEAELWDSEEQAARIDTDPSYFSYGKTLCIQKVEWEE